MKTQKPANERFLKHHAKKPSQKRIDKLSTRTISSFNKAAGYFYLIFNHVTIGPLLGYLSRVVFKFFIPQYIQNIHLRHTPVKHVDHKLDEAVPFDPSHLDTYMGFITFYIRPQLLFGKRYGYFNGGQYPNEFMRYLKVIYDEAYRFYSYSFTTTYRPKSDLKSIKKLHNADPHYMCVPSLHVSLVCACYGYFRMCFNREGFTEKEKNLWLTEIRKEGISIIESVLYLKQHSVNCIPAAMYMITSLCPEMFSLQDAVDFIGDLFKDAKDISEENKKAIFDHIQFTYERFLLEGIQSSDWMDPLKHWLDDYESIVPFYADEEEVKKALKK